MITPNEFKFTIIDGGSSVITNICEDKIRVEKDDEGNRFLLFRIRIILTMKFQDLKDS